MSSDNVKAVTIMILGKEYLISCSDDERNDLISAADFLDDKMRDIRDTGKVIGTDRIAVMAALNIAHELLGQSSSSSSPGTKNTGDVESKIKSIQAKIEDALFRSRQLELEAWGQQHSSAIDLFLNVLVMGVSCRMRNWPGYSWALI